MNIKFNKLIVNNFLSMGEDVKITFSEYGLWLINGIKEDSGASDSNGAGKSTVLEAIVWCLFDRTLRGLKKDDVVNNQIGKDCFVLLSGEIDGNAFEVVRHRKHSTEKNAIRILYNGNELTQRSDSETNKKIEEILNMDFNDFQTNIVFSNSSLKFLELGDTERKQLFDKIINSEIYEKCIDVAKKKTLEFDVSVTTLQKDCFVFKAKITEIEKDLEDFSTKLEDFEKTRKEEIKVCESEINKNIVDLEEIIDGKTFEDSKEYKKYTENKINELNEKSKKIMDNERLKEAELIQTNIRKKQEELNQRIKDLMNDEELTNLENFIKDKKEIQSKLKEKFLKTESEIKILNIQKQTFLDKEKNLDEKRANLDKSKDFCPTCNQELKTEDALKAILELKIQYIKEKEQNDLNITEVGKKIEIELKVMEDIKSEAIILKSLITKLEGQIEIIKSEIKIKEENIKLDEVKIKEELEFQELKIKNIKLEIQADIDEQTRQITLLNKILLDIGAYISRREKNEELRTINEKKLKDVKEKKNPHVTVVEEYVNRKIKLEEENKETENKLVSEILKQSNYKYWVSGFKKIKGLLISTITPIMNEKAIKYSEIISNGEFNVSFVTQKENKDGTLKDVFEVNVERANGGHKYEGMSSGEKRRIDLITIFVLDDLKKLNNIHNINLRFYDEVFDALDRIGIEKTIQLLDSIAENKQVFVISHKEDLKDLFANTMTIINRKGISSIL